MNLAALPNAPARLRPVVLATMLSLAASPAVAALHVAESGFGQVLIFPYYTVETGQQTVAAVENTTPRAKAVAVRFREARNGALVQALNVYLAPNDTFEFAVATLGSDPLPRLFSADASCRFPQDGPRLDAPFSTSGYTGALRDHPAQAADTLGGPERTRSGYIEVFEMGELRAGDRPGEFADELTPREAPVPADGGVPRDCSVIAAAWDPVAGVWSGDPAAGLDPPTGGLRGLASLVHARRGTMQTFAPLALGGFHTDASRPGALHARPSEDRPRLADARTTAATVVVELRDAQGRVLTETFPVVPGSSDPVSLLLMGSRLSGEYIVDASVGSTNEWVLAFPTKRDHVNGAAPRAPFSSVFPLEGRAPERFVVAAHDRTGRSHGDVRNCGSFDPAAPCTEFEAPHSVNVVAFSRSPRQGVTPLLGAAIGSTAGNVVLDAASKLCAASPPFGISNCRGEYADLGESGRVDLAFGRFGTTVPSTPATSDNSLIAPSGRRYFGLPVVAVSFMAFECTSCAGTAGPAVSFGAERGVAKSVHADR